MKTRSSPKEDFASALAGSPLPLPCHYGNAHALAAAAGRRLDHHRIADLVGDLDGFLGVLDQAHMAGHGVHAGIGRRASWIDLVTHRLDGDGVRDR
jgi:hypothetical protein